MRTPDADLYKDKIEISLDGRQVFYLFFGGAVIACLVFVLGVMVGRRVEARAHVDKAAATSAARDPLAALDRLDGGDPMSFRSALGGGPATDGAAATDAAADAIDRARTEAKQAQDARVEAAQAKVDQAKAKAEAEAKAKAEALKAAEAERKAAEAKQAEQAKQAAAEAKKAAKAEPAAEPTPPPAAPGRFTLQLSSFQDKTEAQSFLADVRAAGYKAYLVEADVEGKGRYFRVRFGSFGDYEAALAAKQEFEAKVNKIAYVTRL